MTSGADSPKMRAQVTPPVRHHDGVIGNLGKPSGDALRQHPAALPTARLPIPQIGLTGLMPRGIQRGNFIPGQAFPAAVIDFLHPGVGVKVRGLKAHFGAQDLHSLARA